MNRRIRPLTHGGVRGQEPKGSLLRDPKSCKVATSSKVEVNISWRDQGVEKFVRSP